MNRHLIVIGVAVLLICVGLSGCTSKDDTQEEEKSPDNNSNIVENEPPTAHASADITSGKEPLPVSFNGYGNDTDGTIVSYYWDFGDGGSSSTQDPVHTFQNSETYTITLEVTDDKGETGTDSIQINVEVTNYKFTEYDDYAEYIKPELEKAIGIELIYGHAYGGAEGETQLRKAGKVYFIVFEHGEWDSCRFWAVEVDAEMGELIKYKEVTKNEKYIDYDALWW